VNGHVAHMAEPRNLDLLLFKFYVFMALYLVKDKGNVTFLP
jgi:hypothetical protein